MSHRRYVHDPETHNPRSAEAVVPVLLDRFGPRSVLDVGCGLGSWLRVFADHGCEIMGLEGEEVSEDRLHVPRDRIHVVDLEEPAAPPGRFDMVLCLEVAEHLTPTAGPGLIRLLTGAADVVVFSAAVPGQGGDNHINERWPDYWQEQFRAHGFEVDDALRWQFWEDDRVHWWYRQNLLVARRSAEPSPPIRRVVHPDLLQKKVRLVEDFYRGRVPVGTAARVIVRSLARGLGGLGRR